MNSELLISKVVSQKSVILDGDLLVIQPLTSKVLLLTLLTVVGIAIIFLASSSFLSKETITSYIQSSISLTKVADPQTGIVFVQYVENTNSSNANQAITQQTEPLLFNSRQQYLRKTIENSGKGKLIFKRERA